jgi:hypothetical protein
MCRKNPEFWFKKGAGGDFGLSLFSTEINCEFSAISHCSED